MPKLLKWQEAEVKRIEDLGHTELVDELLGLPKVKRPAHRQRWVRKQLEVELRYRLQIFHSEDSEPRAYGSSSVRWKA